MKKRILSMLLLLCMVMTMLPTAVLAAEAPEKKTLTMSVGETKQLDVPTQSKCISTNTAIITVTDVGAVTAKKAGTANVFVYENTAVIAQWEIKVTSGSLEQTTPTKLSINKDVWPFVPSTKNTTNGCIKSGWYFIVSHDLGQFSISDSGMVRPSRRTEAPFYIEHLGGDVYYIREAYGKYISYNDTAKIGAQVVVNTTPTKWKIYMDYDGQKKYTLRLNSNKDLALMTYGRCDENQDSMVKLSEQLMSWSSVNSQAQFTIDNGSIDRYIPQWYKDLKNGLDAPSETEKPSKFGDVPAALKHTTKEEWDVLRLTNIERAKAGLPMLVTFDSLQKAAGVRSDELMKLYSHTRPNGKNAFTALGEQGISMTTGAENIARGQGTPENVVKDWMNSPGHKANILTEKLRYMGTGFSFDSNGHWVQLFATTNNSSCSSITFNENLGYFTLKLKNGTTAYAPYDPASSPTVGNTVVFNYPGVDSATSDAKKEPTTVKEGWYNLRTMYNYINLDSKGSAELRKKTNNEAFYLENKGNGQASLKLANGKYLGISDAIKDGVQLKAVSSPYLWTIYAEKDSDIFSLRPASQLKMVVNAAGEKNTDGTKVILWTHENLDAPNHAEFRFIPTDAPTSQPTAKHPFTDIKAGSYYENAVVWALDKNITSGTSATTFSPYAACTRGQVVTFLWRAKGSPEPKSANNPFTDVKSSDYYTKAVLWAVENGVTSGSSDTTFSPEATCTSGQVITFLHRSNGKPAANGTSSLAAQYSGHYYTGAIAWADTTDLLSGTDMTFNPDNNAPRADIVTYLYRNVQK